MVQQEILTELFKLNKLMSNGSRGGTGPTDSPGFGVSQIAAMPMRTELPNVSSAWIAAFRKSVRAKLIRCPLVRVRGQNAKVAGEVNFSPYPVIDGHEIAQETTSTFAPEHQSAIIFRNFAAPLPHSSVRFHNKCLSICYLRHFFQKYCFSGIPL